MSQERFWDWPFALFLVVAVGMLLAWRTTRPYPIVDTYPLHFGAKAWLATGNAYDLDAVVTPSSVDPTLDATRQFKWYDKMHRVGNGYPLPAVLLFVPFTFLPVRLASLIWLACLSISLLCALRLLRIPPWMIIYAPVNEALNLEQYTLVVVIAQIVGIWAYLQRDNHRHAPLVLAIACAVMCTKPTQGLILAVVLLALTRNWRMIALGFGLVWGIPTLLDPGWIQEWLAGLGRYRSASDQPIPWYCLLLALPLVWKRDLVSFALIAQFALSPFTAIYSISAVPLGAARHPRFYLLIVLSYLWSTTVLVLLDRLPMSLQELKILIAALVLILPAAVLAYRQEHPLIPLPGSQQAPALAP